MNVNVEGGDTARAPAGILALLQDKMTGGEPNAADTAGTGAQEAAIMGRIDSVLNDTLRNMGDSIPGAVEGYRSATTRLKDSLAASAWADSVDKLDGRARDNGVITGSGSDNCPAVLCASGKCRLVAWKRRSGRSASTCARSFRAWALLCGPLVPCAPGCRESFDGI